MFFLSILNEWQSLFDLLQDWAKKQKVRRKNVHHDTMFCSSSSCYRARRLHFYKKTRPRSPLHDGPLRAFKIGPSTQFSIQYYLSPFKFLLLCSWTTWPPWPPWAPWPPDRHNHHDHHDHNIHHEYDDHGDHEEVGGCTQGSWGLSGLI